MHRLPTQPYLERPGTRPPSRGDAAILAAAQGCAAPADLCGMCHREFRLLWAGQVATAMAMLMERVVRGWLLYQLTDSPVQLGLVQGVQALPMLVLSPVAGSVADRYPRQRQVVVAQGLAGAFRVQS